MGVQASVNEIFPELHWIWFIVVPTTDQKLVEQLPDWSLQVTTETAKEFITLVEQYHPRLVNDVQLVHPTLKTLPELERIMGLARTLSCIIDLYGMAIPTKKLWSERLDPCVIDRADWLARNIGKKNAQTLLNVYDYTL